MIRVCLLLSILAHFGLLWIFHSPCVFVDKPPRYVEVSPAPRSVRKKVGGTAGQKVDARRLRLSDLGIHWTHGTHGEQGIPAASAVQSANPPLAYGSGKGVGGTILDQIGGTVTYQHLHDRIDEALVYPSELVAAGIEGQVSAILLFSDRGIWMKDRSRVRSSSPYLRVHVLRTLREAFAVPLPPTYIPRGQQLQLICVFQFEIARHDNPLDASPMALKGELSHAGVLGNHLYFYRADHVIGVWKIGPIHGYGIVPSVGIDPEQVVDDVADLFSRKAPIDPLEKYRQDPDWP